MISHTVSRRYAQALLEIGKDDGQYTKYGEELTAFVQTMAESDLDEVLANPIYPADLRKQVLDKVVEKMGPSKIVANFLGLLQDKGRIANLADICNYYQRLVDEVNNIKRATVTTASALPEGVQDEVKKTLEKMTGNSIILEVKEDQEIIGGIVAQVGDLTLDGSIKTQLLNLKESLVKG